MTDDSSKPDNGPHGNWPTELWVVVVPGLLVLVFSGAVHQAERLEGVLRQMTIEADMVSEFVPGFLVCGTLLMFLAIRERAARALAFRFLVWAILVAAALLIGDFLAATLIQLVHPPTAPNVSEGLRMALQVAIVLPYLLWARTECKRQAAVADTAGDRGDTT